MNTLLTNSNYVVFKKTLSVHSEDRDIFKWPNSNFFEVTSPVEYKNVVSLRLSDIEIPSSYYVFSNSNQNTKLLFKVIPKHTLGSGLNPTVFLINPIFRDYDTNMKLLKSGLFTITIPEGTYTPQQMALVLGGLLNSMISDFLGSLYSYITVKYNSITHKFVFSNTLDDLELDFSQPIPYDNCSGVIYYDNYTNWGLGSYLGFNKQKYISFPASELPFDGTSPDTGGGGGMVPSMSLDTRATILAYNIIISPNTANVYGDSYIYMELDYCNSMDEIAPYTYKSSSTYDAKYSGKHNSAFAKIPLFLTQNSFSSKETFLSNIFFNDPPLERIQKFKFKMRYHDGRMVDFHNANFTFTIEITMLKPDTIKCPIKVNSSNYKL
jgi:hypothetical protein